MSKLDRFLNETQTAAESEPQNEAPKPLEPPAAEAEGTGASVKKADAGNGSCAGGALTPQLSVAASRRITACLMDIGEIMLAAGGEVSRIEDTISRMGMAYGFRKVDVFTITSCIFATVEDGGGNNFTQTRRIRLSSTDMERVRRCNELSRRVCREPLPEEALRAEIKAIRETKEHGTLVKYLGCIFIASGMAVFFGGDAADFFAAALVAVALRLLFNIGMRANIQNFVVYFLDAFLVGLLIYLMVRFRIGHNYDKIAMGNIMLLIPGAGLTTAVRDMINGDVMTGLMGLTNALVQAAAIALGFVAAFTIFEH